MNVQWLGRISYEEALLKQEDLLQERLKGAIDDTLLLLEHDPVYTIGRTSDRSSLDGSIPLPHRVIEINRGGKATYHGPGQLVGYPIIDLTTRGKDLHTYLRALEESLIALCASLGLPSARREGLTGVWIENRKLASIGVGVRRWITMHGFALNVCGDLEGFKAIVPCGITGVSMTSLERELPERRLTVEDVADQYPPFLERALARIFTDMSLRPEKVE